MKLTYLLPGLCLIMSACTVQYHPVEFQSLKKAESPNNYLVCPSTLCMGADQASPAYRLEIERLQDLFNKLIQQQDRVSLVYQDKNQHHFIYVQRSKWLRFPDIIDVKYISIDNQSASFAIYSRSKYGYYDFNVNKTRIKQWLNLLEAHIKK